MPLTISAESARRALLAHHYLLPPRSLSPNDGLARVMDRLRCIQVDPINTVGTNVNLVLQSRISGYRPSRVAAALHDNRSLVEGWDKLRAVVRAGDWPFLNGFRKHMHEHHSRTNHPPREILDTVLSEVSTLGEATSLDLTDHGKADWRWAPAAVTRAALDLLFDLGEIGIVGRTGSRKTYAMMADILSDIPHGAGATPDDWTPHADREAYLRWHVERRVHSLGIAAARAGDAWLGIKDVPAKDRARILDALADEGRLRKIVVEGVKPACYIPPGMDMGAERHAPNAAAAGNAGRPAGPARTATAPGIAFIAPLDNLIWDRRLIRELFSFEYTWEVYKPAATRAYGYYVLPILYGDEFVARWEPRRDGDKLVVRGFWWEKGKAGLRDDPAMRLAFAKALREFMAYLNVQTVAPEDSVSKTDRVFLRRAARV